MNQDELAKLLAITQGAMTPPSRANPASLKGSISPEMSTSMRDQTDHPSRQQQPSDRRSHSRSARSTKTVSRRRSIDNAHIPDLAGEESAAENRYQNNATPPASGKFRSEHDWKPSFNTRTATNPRATTEVSKINNSRALKTVVLGDLPKLRMEQDLSSTSDDGNNVHKSRFNEGSMTNRSAGVSSAWEKYGSRLSESSSRSNPSADELTPTTPSTIKKTFAKFGLHFKPSAEDSVPSASEQKPIKRKGLRKSLSTWNMHFFGGSTNDDLVTSRAADISLVKKRSAAEMELLDERKRKAEAAYPAQFGTKKQKGNDGQANSSPHKAVAASPSTPPIPSRSIRRPASAGQLTSRPWTSHHPPASPSRSITHQKHVLAGDLISSGAVVDRAKKKLSRKELEKENQQLRALLRERGAGTFAPPKMDVHQDDHSHQHHRQPTTAGTPSTFIIPNSATPTATRMRHKTQRPGGEIPPVPPLPSRTVLATLAIGPNHNKSLGNNTNNNKNDKNPKTYSHKNSRVATIHRMGGEMPSISTILEDNEEDNRLVHMSSLEFGSVLPGLKASPEKTKEKEDKWQWPDDVF